MTKEKDFRAWERRKCRKKISYNTYEDAKVANDKFMRAWQKECVGYDCVWCGKIHLTTLKLLRIK